jgi:two-component system, NtrC family, sensor histidine kinase KinB
MAFGIRQKLMIGFGSVLAIVIVMGVLTMKQIQYLGEAIDIILRENYRSVIASQDMKEALERMDSGILFSFAGKQEEGNRLVQENASRFLAALDVESGNITLPGEGEKAGRIRTLFPEYVKAIPPVMNISLPKEEREMIYFSKLLPLFLETKRTSQEILEMNQANMIEANDAARQQAGSALRRMLTAMVACAILAGLFGYLAHRWILKPIHKLTESTNEIRRGNLDFVLETGSRDEIGLLSESFNEMAAFLRQARKIEQMNLIRTKQATEVVFKTLPEAVAVFDLQGRVDVATETADRYFGLKKGVLMDNLLYEWLPPLIRRALNENRSVEPDGKSRYIQQFIDNREYFFQPRVVPIPGGPRHKEPTGAALILKDVTQVRERQELKEGLASIASHQLKTPLTSLRMSIHLLLEERLGNLNEQQTELLTTAREDSERLVAIVDDLLDLGRIESDRTCLVTEPVSPHSLVQDGIEPLLADAKDKNVTLVNAVPDDLPDVMAEPSRIHHVLANLLSNALRFTRPGGSVTIRAATENEFVRFSVEDTGEGVAPEYVNRLFDPFFRAPGQDPKTGVGLGLAIVKQIIHAHGGHVSAESEIGKGSTFYFCLPVEELRMGSVAVVNEEKHQATGAEQEAV